ncbi:hypothetical protein LCGC14_2730310 [marine sediment metagenome]|uniref:Uncharacterized protein n=1 Tax=marine sediment metagenome TaxID=412755 RepID=A0A0F9BZ55_9ZZZZ
MPRGRFSDRDRSTNRQYWSMSADYRNFWDLLFPWLDAEGRMDGDARVIKGIVCPLAGWTDTEIEEMLVKFESLKRSNGLGWITRYHSNGIYCLWASGFHGHQKGLQISHEAKGKYGYSNIPPPPKKILSKTGVAPMIEDNSFIEELRPKYPHLDLDKEWEKCKLWWSEGNRDMKRPKSAFINWLNKARGSKQIEPKQPAQSDDNEGLTE